MGQEGGRFAKVLPPAGKGPSPFAIPLFGGVGVGLSAQNKWGFESSGNLAVAVQGMTFHCRGMRSRNAFAVTAIMALATPFAAAQAASPPHRRAIAMVAPSGLTSLSTSVDGVEISAVIETIIPSNLPVKVRAASACTGSREPCSLVSRLRIRVGAQEVLVPLSLRLRLADVGRASVRRVGGGRYELLLACGDASEAYDAHVLFNKNRVTQLDVMASEAGALAERTTYSDLSHAFDN